jgi:hypothetical protein
MQTPGSRAQARIGSCCANSASSSRPQRRARDISRRSRPSIEAHGGVVPGRPGTSWPDGAEICLHANGPSGPMDRAQNRPQARQAKCSSLAVMVWLYNWSWPVIPPGPASQPGQGSTGELSAVSPDVVIDGTGGRPNRRDGAFQVLPRNSKRLRPVRDLSFVVEMNDVLGRGWIRWVHIALEHGNKAGGGRDEFRHYSERRTQRAGPRSASRRLPTHQLNGPSISEPRFPPSGM